MGWWLSRSNAATGIQMQAVCEARISGRRMGGDTRPARLNDCKKSSIAVGVYWVSEGQAQRGGWQPKLEGNEMKQERTLTAVSETGGPARMSPFRAFHRASPCFAPSASQIKLLPAQAQDARDARTWPVQAIPRE